MLIINIDDRSSITIIYILILGDGNWIKYEI